MIRIGIVGYGNLARGVECSIRQNPDFCRILNLSPCLIIPSCQFLDCPDYLMDRQ